MNILLFSQLKEGTQKKEKSDPKIEEKDEKDVGEKKNGEEKKDKKCTIC